MSPLNPEIELLRRQYLQQLDPSILSLPEANILKQPGIQYQIYECMFQDDTLPYPPPERYRSRVLKLIVTALEGAMEDPEEDEISDALTAALADSLSQPNSSIHSLSPNDLIPRKTRIAYSAPIPLSLLQFTQSTTSPQSVPPPITILESPSLLSAFSTTGHRTWPASLFLASYLYTQHFPSPSPSHSFDPLFPFPFPLPSSHPSLPPSSPTSNPQTRHQSPPHSPSYRPQIQGRNILELGAGTGLVSLCCALWLGARYALATDGTGEVIDALGENVFLNGLEGTRKVETAVVKWGHAVSGELLREDELEDEVEDGEGKMEGERERKRRYEVVVAADVTFDDRLLTPLVSTLHELAERYVGIEILIAATVRNKETLEKFVRACDSRRFKTEIVASTTDEAYRRRPQVGLFHSVETEIRIYRIRCEE